MTGAAGLFVVWAFAGPPGLAGPPAFGGSFAFANERSRLPVGPRNPRDQIKHHEGIARPRGVLGDDAYDIGHARRSLGRRREEVLLDHGTNQAQSWTLVNPPKCSWRRETALLPSVSLHPSSSFFSSSHHARPAP